MSWKMWDYITFMTSTMGIHLQETIHLLGNFCCQLGFGNGGGLAPPILRSHLHRWSDQDSGDEWLLYEPAGPMVGNQATKMEHR